MVIECIGLPGSGKSFLMGQVEQELWKRGVRCVNASDRSMNRLSWKVAKRLLHAGIFLNRSARATRAQLEKALQKEPQARSRYGIYEDERFTLESIAVFRMVYRHMMRSNTVYLFDEGLVHAIVKFCADFALCDETFLALTEAAERGLTKRRLVVYNAISLENGFRSLKKRDRHICAFDELPDEALRGILQEYTRLNTLYENSYAVVKVYREEETGEKTTRILQALT
jgi:hypothetical protein